MQQNANISNRIMCYIELYRNIPARNYSSKLTIETLEEGVKFVQSDYNNANGIVLVSL